MHHIMNNKTGTFVSALLHTIKYGKPCRFVTDGNIVLRNMKNVYGIDMADFSVLDVDTCRTMPRKGQFVSREKFASMFALYMRASWELVCYPSPALARSVARLESLLNSCKPA